MKSGIIIFLSLFIILVAIIANGEMSQQRAYNEAIRLSNVELSERIIMLNSTLDSPMYDLGSKEVVFHAKDGRNKDFFTLIKIGRGNKGYEIVSDIHDIDRPAFDYVYWTCVDSGVDIPFMLHVLWTESRFGTNLGHKPNSDGTIDGGWFGLNYKDGKKRLYNTPYTDVKKFIRHFKEKIEVYPKNEWSSRYNSKALWKK